jgi:glutamate-1-semialdehyde 2,1-aminomutase
MTTATLQRLNVRAKEITAAEIELYSSRTGKSQRATQRARQVIPLGVPSSFQAYDPHPIVASHAMASSLWDVDGIRYLDLNMGFGALYVGHSHPLLVEAVQQQLNRGMLYVTPCESNAEVAEQLRTRFGHDMWRFTNSGTEATMDAIRLARGFTGRTKIVKVEGGYHGHHDVVMVSMKPTLADAGPAGSPASSASTAGLPDGLLEQVTVVQYNDAEALERALAGNDVACFIVEPVMQNIGICMPVNNYLQKIRQICSDHGTLLIFDEVKTGITAGMGGAGGHFGLVPDVTCLAKSIGGGLPLGAFGARQELMDQITSGAVVHQGTFNGNPLSMAAAQATLGTICSQEAFDRTNVLNRRMLSEAQTIIDQYELPACTVEMGAKGCISWTPEPIQNYRDYKSTDFDIAFAHWMYGINRGILLPPGLDEQWLVSVQHTDADADRHTEVFSDFVTELCR